MSHRSGMDRLMSEMKPDRISGDQRMGNSASREMTTVEGRIDDLSGILVEIGDKLHTITDRMEGSSKGEALASPVRSGWLGALEDLIDQAHSIRGQVSYLSDKI